MTNICGVQRYGRVYIRCAGRELFRRACKQTKGGRNMMFTRNSCNFTRKSLGAGCAILKEVRPFQVGLDKDRSGDLGFKYGPDSYQQQNETVNGSSLEQRASRVSVASNECLKKLFIARRDSRPSQPLDPCTGLGISIP